MALGDRLIAARTRAKLTQKQLEDRSGVSQKTISKIERGDQASSTQVVALARACGVLAEWLAEDSGPMLAENVVRQEVAVYGDLDPDALELARLWSRLPIDIQTRIREWVFREAVIHENYPWLRMTPPRTESYADFERTVRKSIEKDLAPKRRKSPEKT